MSLKVRYKAISRVVEDKQVIGFMVLPQNKKGKSIYMSLDVISFGLSQKTFEIEDVKLSSNGKPRGCNGFLLSKLPVLDLSDESEVILGLKKVLNYILKNICSDMNLDIVYTDGKISLYKTYSASMKLSDYMDLPMDIGNEELRKTLNFYKKHLPDDLKIFFDKIEGVVNKQGITTITVSKSLVREEK